MPLYVFCYILSHLTLITTIWERPCYISTLRLKKLRHKKLHSKGKAGGRHRFVARLSRPCPAILAHLLPSHPLLELQDSWVIFGFLPVIPTCPSCWGFPHWLLRPLLWFALSPGNLGLPLGLTRVWETQGVLELKLDSTPRSVSQITHGLAKLLSLSGSQSAHLWNGNNYVLRERGHIHKREQSL